MAYISTTFPSNQWIIDSHLIQERASFPAISTQNGDILVCGGYIEYERYLETDSSCEIYSSSNREWRTVTDLNVGRIGHTLTLLPNGRSILTVGTMDNIDGCTAEIYDIQTDKWAFVPNIMNILRAKHTATLLRNDQVLIVGGSIAFTGISSCSVQLYIASSNTFITTGSLNTCRYDHTTILLSDGLSVLVIGGRHSIHDINGPPHISMPTEIYINGFWSYIVGDMISKRSHFAAVLLSDGNVLVAGGIDSSKNATSTVEIYNSTTETFSLVQPMACARSHFTLTRLPSGQVLAVGGKSSTTNNCLRFSELYDPNKNQWKSDRLLNNIRWGHNAILLNHSVLIIGGSAREQNGLIRACERYDL
ncbi:unnamed protein product [Adineta steineri]|uniref:Uncharacterized protein n=1 Tax=Adineta steineri TaxID=433720 RepID=A0A815CMC9_9BILA|nr:unnamed protein product [Adineta steineri]CAF1299008.1 unnamed protein product [Adineta steineri]